MGAKEEFEYLKQELLVKLTDVQLWCTLEFPFDFAIPLEEEQRYFLRGLKTRVVTKRAMIILENCYQKIRLFPDENTVQLFEEVRDEILENWKKDVMSAFESENLSYLWDDTGSYQKYIDSLAIRIKESTIPYVEKLKTLTPEIIEKELAQKESATKIFEPETSINASFSNEKDKLF